MSGPAPLDHDPIGVEGVLARLDRDGPAGVGGDGAAGLLVVAPATPRRQQEHGAGGSEATHRERILCAAVGRPTAILCAAATALLVAGCGGEIEVPAGRRPPTGAPCSSTSAAPGATRSTPRTPTAPSRRGQLQGGERTNGPNFNVRKESRDDVLFAIRNGGFSGGIMPANIVVGEDAEAVADFLSQYSGKGD